MPEIELPEPYPTSVRFGAAIVCSVFSIALSLFLIHMRLHLHSGFMLTAIVISAWFGGARPGFLALVICAVAQVLLRPPIGVFVIHGDSAWTGFIVFLMNSLIICMLFQRRFVWRMWERIFPVAVTGGWWWSLDPKDAGSVEMGSPAFPYVSVSRSYHTWLEQIHPDDRSRVEGAIKEALNSGQLRIAFHTVQKNGEIRKVSMSGIKVPSQSTPEGRLTAICLEVGASVPSPLAFLQ
ncbi:MAG: PAS domain-containing protein [Acidobacteriaceae bacterium]